MQMEQVYKQENNEIIRYLAYTRLCIIMLVTFCHLQRKKGKIWNFVGIIYLISFRSFKRHTLKLQNYISAWAPIRAETVNTKF